MTVQVFRRWRFECPSCGEAVARFAWNYDPVPACAVCGVSLLSADHDSVQAPAVHDDQLEGGPRHFETMGPDAPFLSTKSEWRKEVDRRQLVNVVRHDDCYYRTKRKRHDEELRDTGSNREY